MREVNRVDEMVKTRDELMASISANLESATPEQQRELELFLSGYLAGVQQTKGKRK